MSLNKVTYFIVILSLSFIAGCKNPLSTSVSKIESSYNPGGPAPLSAVTTHQTIIEDNGELEIVLPYINDNVITAEKCQVVEIENISLASSCTCIETECRIRIQTNENFFGPALLKFSVSDIDEKHVSNIATFHFTISPVDDPITLGDLENKTVSENTLLSIPLEISDVDQEHIVCNSDNVTITSSNEQLVASAGVNIQGLWPFCIVHLSPIPYAHGTANISISVSDEQTTSVQSFDLVVESIEDPTTVSPLTGVEFDADQEYVLYLPYFDPDGDLATSCAVSDLNQVSQTSACSCVDGTCSIKLLGGLYFSGNGSLKYNVSTHTGPSNTTSVSISIRDTGKQFGIKKISSGTSNTCALLNNGRVRCWGMASNGRYGDGTPSSNHTDYQGHTVKLITNVIDIMTASPGTCALKANGELWCWGLNTNGFLGNGTTAHAFIPQQVPGLTVAKLPLSGGDASHNCVILTDRTLRCWGMGSNGRLGNGSTSNSLLPIDPGLSDVAEVALGVNHTCALIDNDSNSSNGHQVRCWGLNTSGHVGTGDTTSPITTPTPLGIPIENAVDIALTASSTCALLVTGEVKCWGSQGLGQVGASLSFPTGYRLIPALVIDNNANTKVFESGSRLSASTYNVFVREPSGKIWGWGSNSGWRLTSAVSPSIVWTATELTALHPSIQITAADESACSLYSPTEIECWGRSSYFETGYLTELPTPTLSALSANALFHEVGGNLSLTVNSNGTVSWWGWPAADAFRNLNPLLDNIVFPTQITGITNAIKASAGNNSACVMLDVNQNPSDGAEEIKCWGGGGYRQLGVNNTTSTLTPTTVTDGTPLAGVLDLQMGYSFGCALLISGEIKCWGRDSEGQRGNDTASGTDDASSVYSTDLGNATAISVGEMHACAIKSSDSSAWCWGEATYGKLGNNDNSTNQQRPVQVMGISAPVKAISAASEHTCALVDVDGNSANGHQVYCWGRAVNTGTNVSSTNRLQATIVSGVSGSGNLSDAVSIQTNANATCVIRAGGQLTCWGYGALYSTGQNHQNNTIVPVNVDTAASGRPLSFIKNSPGATLTCFNAENGNYCFGGNETNAALVQNAEMGVPKTISTSILFGN